MNGQQPALDLRDTRQAGLYRVMRTDVPALLTIAREEGIATHDIDLNGITDKDALLAHIHSALDFPEDWGRNWDALEDGLRDLSWLGRPTPRLLLWHGLENLQAAAPACETRLCEILEESSAFWAGQGVAFWSLASMVAPLPP
ncbi:barnase inhibitor [Lysobacter pythonis]|uniref:Barnase inhibitor n=1 Tax=Solilutibacter pythonis TaxID=2483112 RepID=A0A3M2HPC6_9GAMM|nr:barstar family protein [Lysobacter pythonis]RMH90878.1 barnase inhibitor [Lysobacter pythonis]